MLCSSGNHLQQVGKHGADDGRSLLLPWQTFLQGRHVGCLDNAMMKTARPLQKQRNMFRDLRPHAWMHGWSKGLPASWFQGFPSLCPLRWCGCRHTLLPLALFGRAGGSTPAQQAH